MLKTTQHSPKQNMYDLAEKGQIIIIFSNYELSVTVARAQMINSNTFFLSFSFNIKSELTVYEKHRTVLRNLTDLNMNAQNTEVTILQAKI